MIMKKIISSVLATSMFLTVAAGAASAATASPPEEVLEQQVTYASSIEKVSALDETVIEINSEGTLILTDDADEVLDASTYELMQTGVERLNQYVASGEFVLENGSVLPTEATLQSAHSALAAESGGISTYAFGNSYWWGYAFTMNNSESIKVAKELKDLGTYLQVTAIIVALYTKNIAATIIAELAAVGAGKLGEEIDYRNEGQGVTINIHVYTPWVNVTTNDGK